MRARVETGKDATPRAVDAAAARRTTTTTATALRVGAACRARASFDEEMRAGEIVDAREEAGGSGRVTAYYVCLLYTSPSPRDKRQSRMPSSA